MNVLPENGPEIADRFAGRHDARISDRFSGIDCYGVPGYSPKIEGATAFACQVAQSVPSGSHLILIGRVYDVLDGQVAPLTYRDGSYHRVVPQNMLDETLQHRAAN